MSKITKTMNSDWQAWVNAMPGKQPSLHVTGIVDVGNESDSATLIFDSIEKKLPPNLVLRVVEKTIFIPRDPGDTKIRFHYSQQSMPGQFDKVIIVYPDRTHATIDEISIAY